MGSMVSNSTQHGNYGSHHRANDNAGNHAHRVGGGKRYGALGNSNRSHGQSRDAGFTLLLAPELPSQERRQPQSQRRGADGGRTSSHDAWIAFAEHGHPESKCGFID